MQSLKLSWEKHYLTIPNKLCLYKFLLISFFFFCPFWAIWSAISIAVQNFWNFFWSQPVGFNHKTVIWASQFLWMLPSELNMFAHLLSSGPLTELMLCSSVSFRNITHFENDLARCIEQWLIKVFSPIFYKYLREIFKNKVKLRNRG